jgi:hypothetical protein
MCGISLHNEKKRAEMKMLKKIGARLMPEIIATGLLITAAPAHSVDLNPEMLQTVDEMVRKMQQDTMQQQYAAMPVKNELPAQIMNNMYNNMYQYASSNYRQAIQPQMVQVIISQLRPWSFPDQFKQRMMPDIVAQMSNQIKGPQLQQMQEGIMAASFPAAMLPMESNQSGSAAK